MKLKLLLVLFLFSISGIFAAQVDTLRVESQVMKKNISNVVIVPESYQEGTENLPVVYLLHGATGDYRDWVSKVPAVKAYADHYRLMIVCPDGGFTSWYFDSPVDEAMQYETYVSRELVQAIDQQYRTIPSPEGRAITGLSMGGHGAFYLAFRHPEVWGAAGSMSGGLDIRPFPNNWDIAKRLGTYAENKTNWEENTVINLVYLLDGRNLKLIFDCGVNDFFYDVNKRMHEKLLERNIPHEYVERPGAHNWEYWTNAVKYHVLFFHDFFESSNEVRQ
ncbi:alpha/beta hydrolase family protein [uncultured Sunxiuqinia sp.]|jgi:S-formylglutathione hydrolase FrmB|uniref:alpha/beta hydrolase n=1 Tax=uncultured Sunxiuqinia sp. TaxID=1573825 RepID=UPI0030DC479B|tara:strand:+ start:8659 stop:9489 length:831 start_codon:yes stop_codon:yes gene_type:complete